LEGHDWVSVDYSSATDNLKTQFVRALVDVLVDKSRGLKPEEIEAMGVVANLKIDRDGPVALRGQPMGSVMSFPMLCLFNRTVVELAVQRLIVERRVDRRKALAHRCLINGDDLLFRDLTPDHGLYLALRKECDLVGFIVNQEKTMVHASWAEINSTLFQDGRRVKKVNLGALRMDGVQCAICHASSAVSSLKSLLWLLWRNRGALARQRFKVCVFCAKPFVRKVLRDPKLQFALHSVPPGERPVPNPFPVAVRPEGYNLTAAEERKVIEEEVARLRKEEYIPLRGGRPRIKDGDLRQQLCIPKNKNKTKSEDNTLQCLIRHWNWKEWEVLRAGTVVWQPQHDWFSASDASSRVGTLVDRIRAFKAEREMKGEAIVSCGATIDHEASFIGFSFE